MAVGLVVNPYFPAYLTFMWQHMGDKLVEGETLRVGREWSPYDPRGPLRQCLRRLRLRGVRRRRARDGRWRRRVGRSPRSASPSFPRPDAALAALRRVFAPLATFFAALAGGGVVDGLGTPARRRSSRLLAAVLVANVIGIGSMLARRAT